MIASVKFALWFLGWHGTILHHGVLEDIFRWAWREFGLKMEGAEIATRVPNLEWCIPRNREEVHGPGHFQVISQEGQPGLGLVRSSLMLDHIVGHQNAITDQNQAVVPVW